MLKIVIDFRMHNASGIGTYLRNIAPFLVKKFDVFFLGQYEDLVKYDFIDERQIIDCNSKIYSIYEQIERTFKIPECDIFWSPHYNIPLLPIRAKKLMVTIHDANHLAFYDTLGFAQKMYVKYVFKKAVSKADLLLTDSIFSQNEIKKYTKTAKLAHIIHCSINVHKFYFDSNVAVLERVREKYNLPDEFILFVGNVKPHKNLKVLLQAMSHVDTKLVIVGKKDGFLNGDDLDDILQNNQDIAEKVHFTGFVDDVDIPVIYNLSKLFVFPSLYEGFGIPPLEAQACGCPVVSSNYASLPEVCGNSVIYFDPHNATDLADKIKIFLSDNELRQEFILRGYENIKRFDWEKSANKIAILIEKCVLDD